MQRRSDCSHDPDRNSAKFPSAGGLGYNAARIHRGAALYAPSLFDSGLTGLGEEK
jgi:hypothetical protein